MKELSVRPLEAIAAKAWATSHSHSLWIVFSPGKNRRRQQEDSDKEEIKKNNIYIYIYKNHNDSMDVLSVCFWLGPPVTATQIPPGPQRQTINAAF